MHNRLKYTLFLILLAFTSAAQTTEVGQNSFSSSLYGPIVASSTVDTSFSRHAFIYRSTVLGDLRHGDTIRSLEFHKNTFDTYVGNTRFRIYLDMSDSGDFGFGNINWAAHRDSSTFVFEGNLSQLIDTTPRFYRFDFNKSGGVFPFDTTKGKHLKILVEYVQFDRQNSSIPWSYENNVTVPQFLSSNETKFAFGKGLPVDTSQNSNVRKPYIRINYPRYTHNFNVQRIYALGLVPQRMGTGDSIKAFVFNDGLKTSYNTKFYLKVSGVNSFLDSVTVDSLVPNQQKIIRFHRYTPVNSGKETLTVFPEKDPYSPGDTAEFIRMANYNVYAHTDQFKSMDGGAGMGDTTGDFTARFHGNGQTSINQISVQFFSTGLPFQLVIWDVGFRGIPNKELYVSDTLYSKQGKYILDLKSPVKVDTNFFVGIRQASNDNVAFAFQWERPVRPDIFYFTEPAGGTSWTPFSPGYNFNFDIQPRIQVQNDISIKGTVFPSDGDTIELAITDSIAPQAVVRNIGSQDQNVPFDVICEIYNSSNKQIYKSVRAITLDAGDSVLVTFDSSFSLINLGTNRMIVYNALSKDKVDDNDTLETQFFILISHDLAVDRFFEPQENADYQLNRDSIWPIIRVVNYGFVDKKFVNVRLRVYNENVVMYNRFQVLDMPGGSSQIIDFDTLVLTQTGTVTFEAVIYHPVDSFRSNDTLRLNVNVIKDDDIALLKIKRPLDNSVYATNVTFRPFIDIRNVGRATQDSVISWCRIYSSNNDLLFEDTIVQDITFQSTKQALFGEFTTPENPDTLKAVFFVENLEDQDPTNDTMTSTFFVAIGNDLIASKVNIPTPDTLMEVNTPGQFPKAVFINQGLKDIVLSTTSIDLTCLIMSADKKDTIYKRTESTSTGNLISYGDSIVFTWSEKVQYPEPGTFIVEVYHNYEADEDSVNNSVSSSYRVARLQSIELAEVFEPLPGKAYELNTTTLKPGLRIHNNGIEDIQAFTTGDLFILKDGDTLFKEDFVIGGLLSMEGKIVTMAKDYFLDEAGTYQLLAWIRNTSDFDHSDDTVKFNFKVYKRFDVAAIGPQYPDVIDSIHRNQTYKPSGTITNLGDSAITIPFSVSMEVVKGATLVYNSNKTIDGLDIGETLSVSFDSSFKPFDQGVHTARLITRFGFDQFKMNDTFSTQFEVLLPLSTRDLSLRSAGIKVYPNPTASGTNIELLESYSGTGTKYTIYNALGVVVRSGELTERATSIDMNDWASGMYYFRFSIDGKTYSTPVLKQ